MTLLLLSWFEAVLPGALQPASLHSGHICLNIVCRFVDIMALAVCQFEFCIVRSSFCVHAWPSICILLHHVPFLYPSFFCCPLLLFMPHGHPHDTWPLSCRVAVGLLPCLCRAALAVSNILLWLYLSSGFCHATLQPPFCFALSPCFTIIIRPCHSDGALAIP